MIEVTTFTADGKEIDTGSAEDEQAAISAARTLWTDSTEHGTGVACVKFFGPDGDLVGTLEKCP